MSLWMPRLIVVVQLVFALHAGILRAGFLVAFLRGLHHENCRWSPYHPAWNPSATF